MAIDSPTTGLRQRLVDFSYQFAPSGGEDDGKPRSVEWVLSYKQQVWPHHFSFLWVIIQG